MSAANLRESSHEEHIAPAHGRVFSPKSRAQFLYEEGELDFGQLNELEGGKLFPATRSGLADPLAPDDVTNATPPADGEIASGGHTTDERARLDDAGTHWRKHAVKSGQMLEVTWGYSMPHKTRRWTYWLTQSGWNPHRQLARDQFEADPLGIWLNEYRPYWGSDAEQELVPRNITRHELRLPQRNGYHVLLAVWDVADTGNAFYQVIDLMFE